MRRVVCATAAACHLSVHHAAHKGDDEAEYELRCCTGRKEARDSDHENLTHALEDLEPVGLELVPLDELRGRGRQRALGLEELRVWMVR